MPYFPEPHFSNLKERTKLWASLPTYIRSVDSDDITRKCTVLAYSIIDDPYQVQKSTSFDLLDPNRREALETRVLQSDGRRASFCSPRILDFQQYIGEAFNATGKTDLYDPQYSWCLEHTKHRKTIKEKNCGFDEMCGKLTTLAASTKGKTLLCTISRTPLTDEGEDFRLGLETGGVDTARLTPLAMYNRHWLKARPPKCYNMELPSGRGAH